MKTFYTETALPVQQAQDILDPHESHGPNHALFNITNRSGNAEVVYHEDDLDQMPDWLKNSPDVIDELDDQEFEKFIKFLQEEEMLAPDQEDVAEKAMDRAAGRIKREILDHFIDNAEGGLDIYAAKMRRILTEELHSVELPHAAPVMKEMSGIETENSRLLGLLTQAGICHKCGGEIDHDVTEPFANCGKCGLSFGEWTGDLPVIQKLRIDLAKEKERVSEVRNGVGIMLRDQNAITIMLQSFGIPEKRDGNPFGEDLSITQRVAVLGTERNRLQNAINNVARTLGMPERGNYDPAKVEEFGRKVLVDVVTGRELIQEITSALQPVMDWYQSDEQHPRTLPNIIADVVGDLQTDRNEVLTFRKKKETILKALNAASGGIKVLVLGKVPVPNGVDDILENIDAAKAAIA